ncbi:hypothetical protein [Candidatus Gromoviella agglomerans]|uniref:hypothetical protein n=1 Tax=Candidatus Gromoviella agglomerans TaxID=2806609 RepID=UPI001E579B72|nr:hypothetical protein [Candidatus Gromoviella agglomerans]UFX98337.1 hypothetical protein Gromo_00228 [Candidatus Gromoviella agglomerans]
MNSISSKLIGNILHDFSSNLSKAYMAIELLNDDSTNDLMHMLIDTFEIMKKQVEYYKALSFDDLSNFQVIISNYLSVFNIKIQFESFHLQDELSLKYHTMLEKKFLADTSRDEFVIYKAILLIFLFLLKRGMSCSTIQIFKYDLANDLHFIIKIDHKMKFREGEVDMINSFILVENLPYIINAIDLLNSIKYRFKIADSESDTILLIDRI